MTSMYYWEELDGLFADNKAIEDEFRKISKKDVIQAAKSAGKTVFVQSGVFTFCMAIILFIGWINAY